MGTICNRGGRPQTILPGGKGPTEHEAERKLLSLSKRRYAKRIGIAPTTYINKTLQAAAALPPKTVTMGQVLACLGLEQHAQWAELVRSSQRYNASRSAGIPKPVSIRVMKDGRLLWGSAVFREADVLKFVEGWKGEKDVSALAVPVRARLPGKPSKPCAWPEPIPKTYPDLHKMYGQDIEKVVQPHFSTEDFEDALQDVYVRLCTSDFLAKWDSSFEKGSPSKQRHQFKIYLRTTVHRTCLNLCRTMSRRWKDRCGLRKNTEVEAKMLLDESTDARLEARQDLLSIRKQLKGSEDFDFEQLVGHPYRYGYLRSPYTRDPSISHAPLNRSFFVSGMVSPDDASVYVNTVHESERLAQNAASRNCRCQVFEVIGYRKPKPGWKLPRTGDGKVVSTV